MKIILIILIAISITVCGFILVRRKMNTLPVGPNYTNHTSNDPSLSIDPKEANEMADMVLTKLKAGDSDWVKNNMSQFFAYQYPNEKIDDYVNSMIINVKNCAFEQSGRNLTIDDVNSNFLYRWKVKWDNDPSIFWMGISKKEDKMLLNDFGISKDNDPNNW